MTRIKIRGVHLLVWFRSIHQNNRQASNIKHTLGNKIVDHKDVVGASPVGTAPITSSILNLTPGFNGLGKDNCKTERETRIASVIYLLSQFQWSDLEWYR